MLDLSLSAWFSFFLDSTEIKKSKESEREAVNFLKSFSFYAELCRDRDMIVESVKKMGIHHGHDDHNGNFCLRFFRDENGAIVLNKKPRLYLIDFDRAKPIT